MRRIMILMVLLLITGLARGTTTQPPQLLGVWYGTYQEQGASEVSNVQFWMLVSWQLSQDGWKIAGHNRWDGYPVHAHPDHDPASAGQQTDYFSHFTGLIDQNLTDVQFQESGGDRTIKARLTSPNSMEAQVFGQGSDTPMFSLTLERIDTGYRPGESTVMGIDLSHHSGAVDWEAVTQAGFQFFYVKASEGVDNPDAMFESHWKALAERNVPRGAYHFYVTEDDPVAQARFFASRLKDDPGTLPPVLDVEILGANTQGNMTETLRQFLETFEAEIGIKPILYTNSKFWDANYHPVFSDYGLWMAEYGVKMPKVPFGWDNWVFWQHVADQNVDGVEKGVDINLLHPNLKLEDLMQAPSSQP